MILSWNLLLLFYYDKKYYIMISFEVSKDYCAISFQNARFQVDYLAIEKSGKNGIVALTITTRI